MKYCHTDSKVILTDLNHNDQKKITQDVTLGLFSSTNTNCVNYSLQVVAIVMKESLIFTLR